MLIAINIVTVDGYFAGPGSDVLALPFDDGFSAYNVELMRGADTLLLGRTSFEGFRDYWPPVADDPSAPPVEREISRHNKALEKVVISDTLTPEQTAPWSSNTRIVRGADAHAEVAALKAAGRSILTFGSHMLWNDLAVAGLVDELHLMVGPALLGSGVPAYEAKVPLALRLLEARVLDGSELVLLRYGVGRT